MPLELTIEQNWEVETKHSFARDEHDRINSTAKNEKT